jgi:hypothetical protein
VTQGKVAESYFRRCVVLFVSSRLVGTVLAQLLLVPAANLIARVARLI